MALTFDAELNDAQAQAVAHTRGPLLVFAGAGSGKTRVITYRIANLVACERIPPYRILAVTFTNKAAGEMRSRLGGLLGPDIARDLWVGTFHATCARLLRTHGEVLGIARSFVIYDTADQKSVVTRAIRDLNLDEKRYQPKMALGRIHKEKQEGRGPEAMQLDGFFDDVIQKVYRRYEEILRAANAVDFEDLILLTLRLLEENPKGEGDRVRRRFEHVLVDEFQDTNATQYRMLASLVRDHHNLCVVGDDDQSIYRWRGADVRNIRGFRHDFPGATVVKLEQNYRSTSTIVDAAMGVIARSTEREPKNLWTANDAGEPIDVVAVADERDEAAYVVATIEKHLRQGTSAKEIAVFYRVHAQSRVLEEALRASNHPYQIVGGTKFYERAEIKDALAYLRVVVNPASDVDLLRIINVPARGIGGTTLDKLTSFARDNGISVWESLEHVSAVPDLGPAPKKKLTAFRDLLHGIQNAERRMSPSDLLRHVLEVTGYAQTLAAEDSTEAEARLENLEELVSSLVDYEAEATAAGEAATLASYLEKVSLQADVDAMADAPKITLMTVHGAKGLEFELVLLTGMEEEMFPYRGLEPGGHEEMEEERRLAYVAITRARKKLVLTHAATRQIFGTTRWGRPSRFVADIPPELVRQVTTRAMGSRAAPFLDRPARDIGWGARPWSHPQAASKSTPPPVAPGERYVDREYFADHVDDEAGSGEIRRGAKVFHARFGEGEVRRVEHASEPAVVAFFPGWGEKKVLARFLKLGAR